jgi:hypothetical protein
MAGVMNLTRGIMLVLPSLLLGAVLMGSIGLPLAYRRGRQRTEDEARIIEGVALAREHKPLAIAAHPPAEASEIPIGAEPSTGRSGLTSPAAAGAALTAARTSGNAAPPLDAQPPPRTGGPAGPLPTSLRELDRWLVMHDETVTVELGWRDLADDLLQTLDRAASSRRLDPLFAWLGRHERHWARHHAPAPNTAAAVVARLAIERDTGLLPVIAIHGRVRRALPPIDYAAYTDDRVLVEATT